MNTVQIAEKSLTGVSLMKQGRCVKYSPITGNVYVYRNALASSINGVIHFVKFVELISKTNHSELLSCNLEGSDQETATFLIEGEDTFHAITVDSSHIVIVD
jgi:hypothetical protein